MKEFLAQRGCTSFMWSRKRVSQRLNEMLRTHAYPR